MNHCLGELKTGARGLLTSEKRLAHRSKRPIEVEAVFGQLKSNNKFNRFTGLEKVELEFLLMALGYNFRKTVEAVASKEKMMFKTQKSAADFAVYTEIYFYRLPIMQNYEKSITSKPVEKFAA